MRLRSMTETYGRAGLFGEAAEKVKRGNELALDMVGQIKDIFKAGHFFVVENPARSYL